MVEFVNQRGGVQKLVSRFGIHGPARYVRSERTMNCPLEDQAAMERVSHPSSDAKAKKNEVTNTSYHSCLYGQLKEC